METNLTASVPMVEKLQSEGFPQVPRIGPYVLLDRLGEGGMGTVYAAYHAELDRQVAVKLLRSTGVVDGAAEVRLLREAQALAKLDHPNVVGVHDAGVYQGHVYLVMERVVGGTLSDWLKEKPRSWREVRDAFVHAGKGLAAAHAAGLVHRDFKPTNVLLGRDGRIKVADFGLARAVGGAEEEPTASSETSGVSRLSATVTQVGTVVGTRAYMAPEQFLGQAADAKSDQFSFCVALWEGLYGQRPLKVPEAGQPWVLTPQTEKREVPPFLKAAVAKGLSQSPQQRFASMEALLEALVSDPAVRRRRLALRLAAAAVALVAVAAVGVGVARQRDATARLCDKPVSSFAGIWDAPTKATLQAAFKATGLSYGEETAGKVVQAFDAYAADWEAVDSRLCRATLIEKTQSEETRRQQSACLGRRRGDVEALAQLLATADAKTVEKAIQATGYLRPPASCGDVASLALEPPGPRQAKNAEAVEQWRKQLQKADTLLRLRRFDEALAATKLVAVAADADGEEAVEVEALVKEADIAVLAGRASESVQLAWKTLPQALSTGSDVMAFRAAQLCSYGLALQAKLEEAALWLSIARGLLTRLGDQGELRKYVLVSEMHYAWAAGDYPKATAIAGEALELTRQLYGEQSSQTLISILNLGVAYTNEGRYQSGVDELRRLPALTERTFGSKNFYNALVSLNLGDALDGVGRPGEAVPVLQQGLSIAIASTGESSIFSLILEHNQSTSLRKLGQLERAHELSQKAVAAARPSMGSFTQFEDMLLQLGRVQTARGELAEARRTLTETQALALKRGATDDSTELREVVDALGQLDLLEGHASRALPLLEKALTMREKRHSKAGDMALTRFALARTLTSLKKEPERARDLAQKAEAELATLDFMKKDLAEVRAFLKKP